MKRLNQQGITSWLVPFILAVVLFLAAAGFGFWAFQGRQDYKNHVDAKIAVAVKQAQDAQGKADEAKYNELEKQPFITYTGPEQYGSVTITYAKTWSSYVDTVDNANGAVVSGYFYPGTVPSINAPGTNFALRMQVLSQAYSAALSALSSQQNPPKVSPYSLPKVPGVIGVRAVGSLSNSKTGDMIILPLRDKTLEVWTEGSQFENDFNNTILPNLTFSP